MSGLAGVLHYDGSPADECLLRRMTAAISHRGPDGIHHVADGPVAIGHCLLCTTPESVHEEQPLWDEAGICCLAMDGRVDNRGDLRRALEYAGLTLRDDTDAELALKSYLAWDEGCLDRIVGDFAFIVYDKEKRRLFCARDPLGVKPFYYWENGKTLLWASELQQLFQHPEVRKEPNEGMVAEYLSARITSLEETLYAGIMRLPPAHAMTVSAAGLTRRCYWDPDPVPDEEPPDVRECSSRFGETLREAVRCRLRSQRPVGAELSGGLDSSSIVGVAQGLFREGIPGGDTFETFSLIFPGFDCDESPFIDAVVEHWCLRANKCRPDEGEWYRESARRHQDFPDHPNGRMSVPIYRALQERKWRACLTGVGGDQWLDREREVRWRHRASFALQPYPRLSAALRRAVGSKGYPPWIPDELARRVGLAERLRMRPVRRRFRGLGQRSQYALLADGHSVHALEMTDRLASRFGLEPRHPFYDRRLVEFALELPDTLHRQGGLGKVLLRRAVPPLLPALVRDRESKAEFSGLFARMIEREAASFDDSVLAARGWLVHGGIRELRRRSLEHPWPRWFAVGIDTWCRTNLLQSAAA